MFDKSIDHPQYWEQLCNYSPNSPIRQRKHSTFTSRVPPRGFIQSIEKINYNHTIHLALILGWQKNAFRPQCSAFSQRVMVHMLQAQIYWREMKVNLYPNANMRQLYESRRYDEGTALEANGASVGSEIPA